MRKKKEEHSNQLDSSDHNEPHAGENPSRPTYAGKAPMLRPAQPDKTKQEEEDMPTFGNMVLANDDWKQFSLPLKRTEEWDNESTTSSKKSRVDEFLISNESNATVASSSASGAKGAKATRKQAKIGFFLQP